MCMIFHIRPLGTTTGDPAYGAGRLRCYKPDPPCPPGTTFITQSLGPTPSSSSTAVTCAFEEGQISSEADPLGHRSLWLLSPCSSPSSAVPS